MAQLSEKQMRTVREKQSEIASALNVAQTNLPKYLKTLIDLDILEVVDMHVIVQHPFVEIRDRHAVD